MHCNCHSFLTVQFSSYQCYLIACSVPHPSCLTNIVLQSLSILRLSDKRVVFLWLCLSKGLSLYDCVWQKSCFSMIVSFKRLPFYDCVWQKSCLLMIVSFKRFVFLWLSLWKLLSHPGWRVLLPPPHGQAGWHWGKAGQWKKQKDWQWQKD